MSADEIRRLENMLAFHAAPTLMGLKCGSLPTFSSQEFDLAEVARMFGGGCFGKRISARFIRRCACRTLSYVYDRQLLDERLSDRAVKEFLSGYGYSPFFSTEQCLDRLCVRLCEKDFPHEIGIFLGYPLEDVKGFIANCGQGCKLCGMWKVYGDVERAKALFECYKQCRIRLCRELENGKQLRSCVA